MSSATSIAGMLSEINATVNFNSPSPVLVGILPAGAVVHTLNVSTLTPFSTSGTAIAVGTSAASGSIASGVAVTSVGRISPPWNASWSTPNPNADTPIYATPTTSSSTSGSARVGVTFISAAG
ncbi:MAG: hypothetical protein WC829_01510 [Hyphomicrobium sp.]